MADYALLRCYLISLGVGLLIGLERERSNAQAAGLRTFSLVALIGTTSALLADRAGAPWLIAASLLTVIAVAIVSYLRDPRRVSDPGITTVIALILCHLLGALLWFGYTELVVTLAVTTTLLLYFKPELHGFSHRISRKEMRSFLQFAAVAFMLLPMLPDHGYGPWEVINPFRMGILVVLISGLSLVGYMALKWLEDEHAVIALGVLGGVASSTATTLAFARHIRSASIPVPAAALIIQLANLTVLVRLGILATAAAPQTLPTLLPVLGCALGAGLIVPYLNWRKLPAQPMDVKLDVRNPAELGSALGFAVLFSLVLLVSAWVQQWIGDSGIYAVAVVSGLTDVDAISLSALRLQSDAQIDTVTAVIAIATAYISNLAFKLGTVAVIADRHAAMQVGRGFGGALLGLLVGLALFAR